MSVGARIAELRRAQGLSQADLAARTGVSRSAVAQWETDRAGQVRGNLSRIAAVLDVSLEVLLHGGGVPRPDLPGVLEGEALSGDALALLRLYWACSAADRAALLREARRRARMTARGDGP